MLHHVYCVLFGIIVITAASQLIDWFIEAGLAEDRSDGVKLGQVRCDGIIDQVMSCDILCRCWLIPITFITW